MDQSIKVVNDMTYKDLIMYYHTSLRNSIAILALSMAVLSFVCTNKIKKLRYLFITLLFVSLTFIGISIYNNILMRKILFNFRKKYGRSIEIDGFIITSGIIFIIECILIISALYILYTNIV